MDKAILAMEEPTKEEIYALALQVCICPRCMKNLSDIRTDGKKKWRYCFCCFSNFDVEEDLPDDRTGEGASGAPEGDPDAEV